ncbi:MAG: MBOAT family protein [Lachnospiraceae bacterium]|nr:MBOAT family protein [Lachnospiraceae bacterium]
MLFNSYIFILLFLPLVVSGYFLINKLQGEKKGTLDLWWIFAMSLWFYGYSVPKYLVLILFSIFVNFFVSKRISANRECEKKKNAKVWMITGVAFNLGLLFYFKYYDFFISNMNALFKEDWALKYIALPLGISFFTFQQVSYIVDSYRDKEIIRYRFIEYAAYVTFFPQLVAGPIVMHSELIPQMKDESKKKIDFENLSQGVYALALGLGKKVLLADTLSKIVTFGYGNISSLNAASALVVMVSYFLQIYFDFSGYCDMALGMAKMFNMDLPINFNSPYKAKTVNGFWDRWHLTLSRFFIQYVYIPLGGSRKGKVRTYVNTAIVFLLSGMWHGANWTFFIWGITHGFFSICEKIIVAMLKNRKKVEKEITTWADRTLKIVVGLLGYIYMFVFKNLTLVMFRADSVTDIKEMYHSLTLRTGGISEAITSKVNDLVEVRLLARLGFMDLFDRYPALPCIVLLLVLLFAVYFMKNTQEKMANKQFGVRRSLVTVFLIVWSVISLSDVSEFLYFNF